MIVGFSERSQTISESDVPIMIPGLPGFLSLPIEVVSLRVSETGCTLLFLVQMTGNATVEATNIRISSLDRQLLNAGTRRLIPTVNTMLINDYFPEPPIKCFNIRVLRDDRHCMFTCLEDTNPMQNYSCEHTICILDDDG